MSAHHQLITSIICDLELLDIGLWLSKNRLMSIKRLCLSLFQSSFQGESYDTWSALASG